MQKPCLHKLRLRLAMQLWEPLLRQHKGLSNSGKCEKACCCPSGLLSLLFLFLLPWYPWPGLVNGGLVSDGLQCPHDEDEEAWGGGSPRNSPHTEEFCSL